MKSRPPDEVRQMFQANEAMCREVVAMLELVSNKARLRIVCMLMEGDYCVQDIVDVAGGGKATNVSQQLRMLRLAGVVEARRSGKQIYYRLNEGAVPDLVRFLRKQYLNKACS
ncbi:MAG: winged helix-turn-helix transcriptional regulator [Verrucomicrobiae bacterium]|nr:winged helix-turn-helix transcriptional regulator [Verrucomicrobiae bacterium]